MTTSPLITVVVCTLNRADSLRHALDSLTRLDPACLESRASNPDQVSGPLSGAPSPAFEILVIDNGSTDDTPLVVAEIGRRSPVPVRHVVEPRRGIVPARNRGVQEARGEWIAFFDDDQLADRRWLHELLLLATEKGGRCVGGAVHLKLPEGVQRRLSPTVGMLLGETVNMPVRRRYSDRVTPGAGNLMIHRSVFEQVGLFDERCADRGEDTHLFLRIHKAGIEGWYSPDAIILHVIPPERLEEAFLIRLAERMSRGMARVECDARGPILYPIVWLARVAHFGLALAPHLAWAVICGDREAALGLRCRMRIARKMISDGWRLLLPRRNPVIAQLEQAP